MNLLFNHFIEKYFNKIFLNNTFNIFHKARVLEHKAQ